MAHDNNTERRQSQRHRTLLGARVSFNSDNSTIDCMVRNLSDGGAKLSVTSAVGIPDRVSLLVTTTHGRRDALVVWRKAAEIGVSFAA